MAGMMLSGNDIVVQLRAHKREIGERFAVRRIRVFGSRARGTAGPGSDVDVLVEMDNPTFDRYMDLKCFLEELFQARVDLVLTETVKPRIKPQIEREVVYAHR